jgi:internalin A
MSESQSIPKTVQDRIEHARREQSKVLNFSGYMLKEVPDEVFDLRQLEILNLSGNNIREVPERIHDLPNLKKLVLTENPIEKVPDIPGLALDWDSYLRCRKTLLRQNVEEIRIDIDVHGDLSNISPRRPRLRDELALLPRLQVLHITLGSISDSTKIPKPTGEIRDLIDNLDQFDLLESLEFWGVLLGEVPSGIRSLRRLHSLEMFGAGLREIPNWLGELGHLHYLSLGMNELTALPDSLAYLSELKSIYLGRNQFAEIPEVVFRMRNLSRLDISCGRVLGIGYKGFIKHIPAAILRLPKLETINADRQPIEVPPLEVVKEGVEAIKNYWRQRQEAGIDYLCEAKLIVLGEAGAGKTTLARKIENRAYQLQPQEPSTEGIDVAHWSFPYALRIKREGRQELHPADFEVNIWDFGGQEIYHATHQFFLTRRSLYALVADDRKEDTDFNYWLQVVELLSDGSPLLIVQNEKQDRQRDIDLGSLRARFPNLREAFRINLATNRGLDELERAIRQELERLPHIGTPLPKTWLQVRAALESDPRNYISLDEYLTICQHNGFTRREDKLQLSGYLHDLGICLHFQDDAVLKNTVILKPKWGTDAVYRVLDDHAVLDQRGRFGPTDLARIWSDEHYSSMHDELLRLMMKFQLCYQLPDTRAYIAPQLLSPTRPAYEWASRDELVLRYEYDFMPKGILTRFIVATNHLIADQSLVWKSGVVLARQGTRAEIVEDYPRRKIAVRVSGADTRGLLAIVDDQLDRIHASFGRLKYEKFLPCNCEVCRRRDEPYAYSLSELKDFAAQGDGIQCRVSRKLVDAGRLIQDVLPSAAYSRDVLEGHHGIPGQEIYLAAEPAPLKEVFVSYAWTEESTVVVDKIQEAFKGRDIVLVRDKNEMRYKDSIRDFMKRIGRGKCIVVVLSRKYLESKNCMFEMAEIAGRGEIRDRVFPIVLDDARIYDAVDRLDYITYWEQKKQELDAKMKAVGGENLHGIREELDLFADIRATIAQIVDILGDMNALTLDQHQDSSFDSLLQALEARLSE